MRILALTSTLLAGLVGPLHAASLPPFEVQAETAHFVYYSRGDRRVDVKRSERFIEKVAAELHYETRGQTAYYRVDHAAEIQAKLGLYRGGATDLNDGTILSVLEYDPHEIVHRLAAEIGDPGLFFHEGLAVALADRGRVNGKKVDGVARAALRQQDFTTFLHRFDRSDQAYAVAGSFVKYLQKQYGSRSLKAFFESCGSTGHPAGDAFEQVFGLSLDAAAATWQATL